MKLNLEDGAPSQNQAGLGQKDLRKSKQKQIRCGSLLLLCKCCSSFWATINGHIMKEKDVVLFQMKRLKFP